MADLPALVTGVNGLRRCSDFWFKLVCSFDIGVPGVLAQIRTTSAQQRRRRRNDDCEEKEILSLLVGCGAHCVYNGDLDRSNSLRCLTSNGLSVSSHSREQKATTDNIKLQSSRVRSGSRLDMDLPPALPITLFSVREKDG